MAKHSLKESSMDIRAILDFRVNGDIHAKIGRLWNGHPKGQNCVMDDLSKYFEKLNNSEDKFILSNAPLLAGRYMPWQLQSWMENCGNFENIIEVPGLAVLCYDPPDYEYRYNIDIIEPKPLGGGLVEYPIPSITWEKIEYADGFYPLERKLNSNRFYDYKLPNLMDIVLCEDHLHEGKEVVEKHQIQSNVEREDKAAVLEYAASLIREAEQRKNRKHDHETIAFPSSAGASVLKLMHEGFQSEELDCRADYFIPFQNPDQDLYGDLEIAIEEAFSFLNYRDGLMALNHYYSTDEKVYAIKNRYFSPVG
jgi:hypothetical protein